MFCETADCGNWGQSCQMDRQTPADHERRLVQQPDCLQDDVAAEACLTLMEASGSPAPCQAHTPGPAALSRLTAPC